MVSADSLELRYAFWPLFKRQVIIPKITFVRPKILIEKDRTGKTNYSDIFGAGASPKKKEGEKGPARGVDIDLIVNEFGISGGELAYNDHLTGRSGLKDISLSVSNITLVALKPIDFRFSSNGEYQGRSIPVLISGKVAFDVSTQDELSISDLVISIAGETIHASVAAKGLKKAPSVDVSIRSGKLTLDPLIAAFAGGGAAEKKSPAPRGALTRSLRNTFSSIPSNLTASLSLDIRSASLVNLKLDSFSFAAHLKNRVLSADINEFVAYNGRLNAKSVRVDLPKLEYSVGNIELKGFNASPFLNDVIDSFAPAFIDMKNNIEGTLDVALQARGSGIEMPDALDNLRGSGVVLLTKGRIKRIASLSVIAEQYNISFLKHDMIVDGLRVQASFAKKLLDVDRLSFQDTDLSASFKGGLDFNKMSYRPGNVLNVKLSPAATRDLPRELSFFRDDKGFVSIDFELQGSLYKPVPSPILKKPLEAAVGRLKVEIEAKKIEVERQAKEQLKTIEAEARQKIEEEAKKKIIEILRF